MHSNSSICVQLIIMGKISAGILLASAAYRAPPEFKRLTGIEQAQLLTDPVSDTTVHSICTADRRELWLHAGRSQLAGLTACVVNAQCYVGYTEGSAYIVFRGASGLFMDS